MIEFNFPISSFRVLLPKLAEQLQTEMQGNTLVLPSRLGKGRLTLVNLPNKLEALITDFTLTQDFWINRSRSDQEYYIFICEEITNGEKVITKVDDDKWEVSESRISRMYLLSFLSDLRQFASAGSHISGIRVILGKEWLASYLRVEQMDEVLRRYLSLKAQSIHIREMDYETHNLLQQVLHPPADLPMENAYMQNRIMMILENFFTWLSQQMSVLHLQVVISRDEIEKIQEVEKILIANLSNAPTIQDMSRKFAISPSKLKKQFREVYGLPPYEYFQQLRMQKARDLLLAGDKSIKEIGRELGYANLSNFTLAFRKVFHINPGEYRKKIVK